MSERVTVLRHSLAVRLSHWSIALSGMLLLFSGFGELPMYKRYNLVKIPGLGWSDDFELHLLVHYVAAVVFAAAIAFHVVYHWRRRELAALPRRGDLGESWRIIKAILTRKPEPPSGKFLAEQRLAYAAVGLVSLLLLGTGLVKAYKNLGAIHLDPSFLQVVTLAHTVGAMLFLLVLLAHLGAFLLKPNRALLPSMFTGRVVRDYAEERHPLWDAAAGPVGETAAEARARLARLQHEREAAAALQQE